MNECYLCGNKCTGKYIGFWPKSKYSKKLKTEPVCFKCGSWMGTKEELTINQVLESTKSL